MLKFIKHHLDTISGIEIYPILSFVIFFLFFAAVTWWVFTSDKQYLKNSENIPLND